VTVRWPALRIKNVPLFWLPYATVPITKRVRNSGFLTPSFGNSNIRGPSVSIPYYQTMGPSADVLPRLELFTQRGIGVGADFRARTSQTSHFNTGFFAMFDRLFGQAGPDQGGTAFYLDAVQYLPAGFLLAADVNITSNLAFRQIFSDNFQQAISPEERTQIYLNNNFNSFSFNWLGQSRDVFLGSFERFDPDQPRFEPGQLVTIRQFPSFELSGRPLKIAKRLPIYVSFRSAAEGVSRAEATVQTPSVVQRLDFQPRITIPLPSLGGLAITPSLTLRSTFYSDTLDPTDRLNILGQSLHRTYLELAVDLRPPALERVFHHRDGSRWFKHVIEPALTYRRITGIGSDFARLIRFDEHDTVADTNEFEFALVNRFFVTREGSGGEGKQPHEWLTLKLSQQYFFDPTFGGALVPGQRNQFYPINRLSGFSFGGTARRFSPVNLTARLRPLSSLFADVRLDYDTREKAVRNASVTGGIRTERFSFSQTWYVTRQIRLDQGTFPANLYQSSVFLGNPQRGPFVGFDVIYDFTNRNIEGNLTKGRLVSSTIGLGYAFDCCTFQVQNTTFKIGLRSENRLAFSLTLRGLGSFGRDTDAGRRIFGPQSR
jgi:LPS-assembly protein